MLSRPSKYGAVAKPAPKKIASKAIKIKSWPSQGTSLFVKIGIAYLKSDANALIVSDRHAKVQEIKKSRSNLLYSISEMKQILITCLREIGKTLIMVIFVRS